MPIGRSGIILRSAGRRVVMPGLVPGIHVLLAAVPIKTWMAGTFSAKTRLALLAGHDGERNP
jgi:hypothetical protein